MNRYEFIFISAAEDKKLLQAVEELITSFEGKVDKKEEWGKKPFAYRMNNITEGNYYVWSLQLNGAHLSDLKNKLNLEERIIRYLILKQD